MERRTVAQFASRIKRVLSSTLVNDLGRRVGFCCLRPTRGAGSTPERYCNRSDEPCWAGRSEEVDAPERAEIRRLGELHARQAGQLHGSPEQVQGTDAFWRRSGEVCLMTSRALPRVKVVAKVTTRGDRSGKILRISEIGGSCGGLKIRVSMVRFRPWPPTHRADRGPPSKPRKRLSERR